MTEEVSFLLNKQKRNTKIKLFETDCLKKVLFILQKLYLIVVL